MVILKLSGIDDRNAAEAAKGTELFITEADLPELPEGQFYIRDLIGMEVEEQGGSFHGVVTDVLQNTAQDIFEVKRDDGKTVLIFGNTVTHRRVFEVPQVIFHVLGMWVTKSGDHAGQIGPLCVHPHHAEHNRACIGDVGRLIQFDETHSFIHMFEN